jgi:7-keto-8-aminopelargonate synthetase-like enzyme
MPASVQICQQMQAAAIDPGGVLQELTLFSLNDYLGLACHPDVRAAAAMAACQVR